MGSGRGLGPSQPGVKLPTPECVCESVCQAVWPRKPLTSRPSPGLRAQRLPFEAGSCGRSTAGLGEPAWTSRCQTAQVSFERLHTTGLSFRLQFQEKAPTQAENGRGLHCREDSRAWESNRAGRVVILTACSLPVGRWLARSRFLAHKGACARAVVQQQAGAELPAVEICAFNEGRRRGDPRWQARGLLSICKTPMATSGHRWQSRCCFCGMEGHGVTSRTFSTPRAR